jgi:hypothetical protein
VLPSRSGMSMPIIEISPAGDETQKRGGRDES